jgi:hypothetical protein
MPLDAQSPAATIAGIHAEEFAIALAWLLFRSGYSHVVEGAPDTIDLHSIFL